MLFAITGLPQRWPVEGIDGRVGTVKDFLFDDQSWKIRWMVLDIGHWLPGRQILIHPSAIVPLDLNLPERRVLPMLSWGDTLAVSVRLTKQQIEASPEAREDEPVTKRMEAQLCNYYGWDPSWEPRISRPTPSSLCLRGRRFLPKPRRVRRKAWRTTLATAIHICAALSL